MVKASLATILALLALMPGGLAGTNTREQLYLGLREGSTVMQLTSDRDGLIWAATAAGIYRFDGLHYHNVPGYPFPSAWFIASGRNGVIWAGGPQGLARYESSQWKTILTQPVEGLATASVGVWATIGGNRGGLRLISESGFQRPFAEAKPTGELVVDGEGALWFPCGDSVCTMRPPEFRLASQKNPALGNWKKVIPEKGGRRYWVSSQTEVAVVEKGAVQDRQRAELGYVQLGLRELLDPVLSPDGTVWGRRTLLRERAGLRLWNSSEPGMCSYFTDDSTLWYCGGVGIGKSVRTGDWTMWAKRVFTTASPEGFVAQRAGTPLLFSDRGLLELSDEAEEWTGIAAAGNLVVKNMIEDGVGGYWLATKDEGLVRVGEDHAILERFPALCAEVDTIRALLRDRHGRTWVGGKMPNCFFEVQGRPGAWKFVPQKLPGLTLDIADLQGDPDGRPWVGYGSGIAYLADSGEWRQLQTSEPITSVRNLEFGGKDVIWVSRRRGPAFFARLEKMGSVWQVRSFEGPGYDPAETLYVRQDSRGWIWRGMPGEVQVARPGRYQPADWVRLRLETGMASVGVNLRGWSEDASGNVWLAGGGGVTKVRPSAQWFDAPKGRPLVTRVAVGGQSWLDPRRLPHSVPVGRGAISIDLSGIDANPFQKSPLRYRLAPPGKQWQSSADGRLRFAGLGTGSYVLEAAYSGDGNAEVMRWEFQVGTPGSPYLLPASALGLLGLLAPLGWRRRDWLHYWLRKPIFLMGRRFHRREADVSWTNYSGRTLRHRYQVLDAISRSEFSITYSAKDLDAGRVVVIKVLHRTPGQERSVRHRFAQEVAALHTLNHPGVVRLLDSWISPEGEACLAMEYLEGPTLRQLLIEAGPLPPVRLAKIVEQLGAAVSAIHESGIVHRDLKPENAIVLAAGTPEERVVIIDFGSSASRGPEMDHENTITLTGSLHYIAPERLGGQYSPASDLYSLGVMILELGSSRRPAEMEMIPQEPEFVQVTSVWAGMAAAGTLVSALHHQPSRRPGSAREWTLQLARELREFSAHCRDVSPST